MAFGWESGYLYTYNPETRTERWSGNLDRMMTDSELMESDGHVTLCDRI